jgi:hypothetical protein
MAGDPVDAAPLRSGPRGDEAQKAKGTPQGAEDGIGPVRRGVSAGAGPERARGGRWESAPCERNDLSSRGLAPQYFRRGGA